MTDSKIRRLFHQLIQSKLRAGLAWLNQTVTIILVPSTHSHSITVKFRPLWSVLILIALTGVGVTSAVVLSNSTTARLAKASLAGELENSRQALDDVHSQVENMVALMDQFQSTISLFDSKSQDPGLGTDHSAQDFIDITSAVGMMGSSNMSDIERLKLLNSSLESSMSPLKESLSLLANQQRLLRELPTRWPVKNHNQARISFLFGPNLDPINRRRWYLHRGLDIAGSPGTPLVAAAGGKVVEVDYSPSGYGNYVIIKHKYGIYTLYAHQQRVFVRVGDIVSQGDNIGLMGATGRVTGPHVHFEIRIGSQIVDPIVYLRMADVNRKEIDTFFDRNHRVSYRGGRD